MSVELTTASASDRDQESRLATSEILFTRIVVATDFSKPADQALKMAILISQLFGSKLSLVHASAPIAYAIDTGPIPIEALNANLEADKAQMKQLVLREPGLSELKPKVVVEYGEPVNLIRQVSREERADLIVVGSHGASGLERLALGSVAEAVLRQATYPVLIVGPNCRAQLHPFRSILFATDLKTTGLRGAQFAAGLAERFHGKITVLHVANEKSELTRVEREGVEESLKQRLQQHLPPDVDRYCKSEARLEYGKPAEVIASVARSECASLVVVGLKDRTLAEHAPWSTLSHVIREVTCPVLGVRGHFA